jgi:hypothetical protein
MSEALRVEFLDSITSNDFLLYGSGYSLREGFCVTERPYYITSA